MNVDLEIRGLLLSFQRSARNLLYENLRGIVPLPPRYRDELRAWMANRDSGMPNEIARARTNVCAECDRCDLIPDSRDENISRCTWTRRYKPCFSRFEGAKGVIVKARDVKSGRYKLWLHTHITLAPSFTIQPYHYAFLRFLQGEQHS